MRRAAELPACGDGKKFSRAFTMLELIFVIVVMGIIGKIGAEVLRVMYENYISTAVNNRMQADTELTLQQIANRLQYRIRDSIIASNAGSFVGLSAAPSGTNYTRIEWIGYDIDGWMGTFRDGFNKPAWSGFIDVDALGTEANETLLFSPETNTTLADNIISAVSSSSIADSAIFFTGANTDVTKDYGWYSLGLGDQNGTAAHRINAAGDEEKFTTGNGDDFSDVDVYEQYKLAWTAYALSVEDSALWLYYDYQPWEGENTTNGTKRLLLKNVSTAKAQAIGDTIKLQICVDNNQTDNYSLCKEKVIF